MGNSSLWKTFDKGSLLITLDHQHFMAGQRVSGEVSYKLDATYPSDQITLTLLGKEKVMWEGSDS